MEDKHKEWLPIDIVEESQLLLLRNLNVPKQYFCIVLKLFKKINIVLFYYYYSVLEGKCIKTFCSFLRCNIKLSFQDNVLGKTYIYAYTYTSIYSMSVLSDTFEIAVSQRKAHFSAFSI